MSSESTVPKFESWPELARWLLQIGTHYIYRGQADPTWGLETRLQRSLKDIFEGAWLDRENLAIGQFKAAARHVLADPPEDSDILGWLSLMQHYGAPTRLLDWTESAFIGLWFAYADEPVADHVALWALDSFVCRSRWGSRVMFGRDHLGIVPTQETDSSTGETRTYYEGEYYDRRADETDLVRRAIRSGTDWPLPILPLDPDPRMVNQRSVFVVDNSLRGIDPELAEQTVVEWEGSGPRVVPYRIVHKMELPAAWRREVLQSLRSMGVSALTLFPGLDGAGRDVSLSLDADLALGFRDHLDGRFDPRREMHGQVDPLAEGDSASS